MKYRTGDQSEQSWIRSSIVLFALYVLAMAMFTVILAVVFVKPSSDIENSGALDDSVADTIQNSTPALVNVPPGNAYVNEFYTFTLRVSDADTDLADISVEVIEGPSWLSLEGLTLSGTPIAESAPEKVVVTISDGLYGTSETFYISVETRE